MLRAWVLEAVQLLAPARLAATRLGSGNRAAILAPTGSMRFGGTTFPENWSRMVWDGLLGFGREENGSKMGMRAPAAVRVWEKSPPIWAAVGTVRVRTLPMRWR